MNEETVFWDILLMIVGCFVGTAMGLGAGYWYDLYQRESAKKEQICSFITHLKETVSFNVELSTEMQKIFDSGASPNFLYDVAPIQSLMFFNQHLVREDMKFDSWNWIRYKMTHVNNAIAMISNNNTLAAVQKAHGLHAECHKELSAVRDELSSRSCACVL